MSLEIRLNVNNNYTIFGAILSGFTQQLKTTLCGPTSLKVHENTVQNFSPNNNKPFYILTSVIVDLHAKNQKIPTITWAEVSEKSQFKNNFGQSGQKFCNTNYPFHLLTFIILSLHAKI